MLPQINLAPTTLPLKANPHLVTAPTLTRLTDKHRAEALDFLSTRPVHTVNLVSLILDNGFDSELNRGTFYAYRDLRGHIQGIALIGHAIFIEARTDRALQALAHQAQRCGHTHMVLGEREHIEEFWSHYAGEGQQLRLACRELLFELTAPVKLQTEVEGLRLATLDDLELILPVHAQMAEEECGVNPFVKDPEGFRRRCARRIQLGRVWVSIAGGRLVFKADVQADTPVVSYLEGVYVSPEERGKGYGLRCLSQITSHLLKHRRHICLLVNDQNTSAHSLYLKAGFKVQSCYHTIFLQEGIEADRANLG